MLKTRKINQDYHVCDVCLSEDAPWEMGAYAFCDDHRGIRGLIENLVHQGKYLDIVDQIIEREKEG